MHKLFADWYRVTGVDQATLPLDARWQAVEAISKWKEAGAIVELVRLAYQRPALQEKFIARFREEFKKADQTFAMRDNDFELSVLAASAMVQLIEPSSSEPADLAALCCQSANYLGWQPAVRDLPEVARSYLNNEALRVRTAKEPLSIEKTRDDLKKAIDAFKQAAQPGITLAAMEPLLSAVHADARRAGEAMSALAHRLEELHATKAEELDILWWLFSGLSRDMQVPWRSIDPAAVAIVAAKELSDLTAMIPGPLAAPDFLRRALLSAGEKGLSPATLQAAINGTSREWRTRFGKQSVAADVVELMPICLALKKSLETDKADDWVPAAAKATGLRLTDVCEPLATAQQTYSELLLVRAYQAAM